MPTCLKDLNLSIDDKNMNTIIEKAVDSMDMKKMPYKVSAEMLKNAMNEQELYVSNFS